jgi:hypothetical protein
MSMSNGSVLSDGCGATLRKFRDLVSTFDGVGRPEAVMLQMLWHSHLIDYVHGFGVIT